MVEAIGTCCLVYTSGVITVTLLSYKTIQLGAYIGISNIVLLSVFINATVATMGGHLNPTITLSAVLAGICPAARGRYGWIQYVDFASIAEYLALGFFYLCGQLLGSALASGLLMGIFGRQSAVRYGLNSFFRSLRAAVDRIIVFKAMAASTILSRSRRGRHSSTKSWRVLIYFFSVTASVLTSARRCCLVRDWGPLLVASSLDLISFATSRIAPGYAGAQMNPARCFAYGIARRNMAG